MSRTQNQVFGRRSSWYRRPACAAGMVVVVLGGSLAGCGGQSAPTTAPSTASRPATLPAPTTTGSTTPTTTGSTATTAPAGLGSYLPLFPFLTPKDVQDWQQSYASGGQQPWHLDAGQTALAFAAWLGYTETNKVIGVRTDRTGAHVSVGFHVEGQSSEATTSAIVHLVRWGTGSDSPWEIVGTDDTTFSLTSPAYGATIASPVTVGGLITGVDENIKVQVRSSSSTVGTYCCLPAGGETAPWSATVSLTASSGTVLTIAAQTGGHVAEVERFTVTGVRVH